MNANKSNRKWILLVFALALILPGIFVANRLLTARAEANNVPVVVYDATAARDAAIVYSNELSPAYLHVYDSTATMLAAIHPQNAATPVTTWHVYDATEAMLNAVVFPTFR